MSKTAGVWGIDIGQCALKALRLELIDGKPTATAFDYIEHAKILSQPDADPDALTREALEKFLSRNPIGKDQVAIGIPGQSGLARFVKLPPVEEKKIPDIVKFEAKQQIPFPLEEVVWDYQKIGGGENVGGFAMETEIGLFAMKRDLISKTLGHYQGVKAEVHVVQMTPLALCNYATYEVLGRGGPDGLADGAPAPENDDTPKGKKRCAVVLDIGTDSSNLIITDGGKIIWQRPVPLGGNSFTKALVKEMKLTFAKAEHLKRNAAKSPELAQILKSLRPVLQDFVGEVQRSLGYFTNTHRDAHVAFLVGLGSAFKLPGLQKYLSEKLSLEVRKPAKMTRLTGDTVLNDPTFNENVLTFPVVYGLALQGLDLARLRTNLLPNEIRVDRIIRAKKPWAALAASLLVGGLAAACVNPAKEYDTVARAVGSEKSPSEAMKAAKDAAGAAKKQNEETAKAESAVEAGKTQVKAIVAGNSERLNWVRLNEVIGAALPRHGFIFEKDAAANTDVVDLFKQLGYVTDEQVKAALAGRAFEIPQPPHAPSNLTLVETDKRGGPLVNQPSFWSTVNGRLAFVAHAKRIAKGVPPDGLYADLSEHLAQVNVEAVTARYVADPVPFLKAAFVEAEKHGINNEAVTSMMSEKDSPRFVTGPGGKPVLFAVDESRANDPEAQEYDLAQLNDEDPNKVTAAGLARFFATADRAQLLLAMRKEPASQVNFALADPIRKKGVLILDPYSEGGSFLKTAREEAKRVGIDYVGLSPLTGDKNSPRFLIGANGAPVLFSVDEGKANEPDAREYDLAALGDEANQTPEELARKFANPDRVQLLALMRKTPDKPDLTDPIKKKGVLVADPTGGRPVLVPDPTGRPLILPAEKKYAEGKWAVEPPMDPKTKAPAPVWIVEVRGYTYFSAGDPPKARRFLQECFVRNLQRFDEFAVRTDGGQDKISKYLSGATDPVRGRVSHAFLCIAPKPSEAAKFDYILKSKVDDLIKDGAAAAAAAGGGAGEGAGGQGATYGPPPAPGGRPGAGGPGTGAEGPGGAPGGATASGRWLDLLAGGASAAGGGFSEGSVPLGGVPGVASGGGGPTGPGGEAASPRVVGGLKKPFEFVVYFLWQEPSSTDTPPDAAAPAGK